MAVLDSLETGRLILRPMRTDDATVQRQLWTERDVRVPPHRRIGPDGRPSVDDIAVHIGNQPETVGPRLLTVVSKDTGEVIGYCGLITNGNGSIDEPELAYELLRAAHGCGYATEAARAVVDWAGAAGYRRLWAGVWAWNLASRRVLSKLGFREVRTIDSASGPGDNLLTVRDL